MTVVLMGAAGAGKTTIGRQLATDLGWPFFDADSVHTPEDVARMGAGQPLTDAERAPWLRRVGAAICEIHRQSPDLVVACSALKQQYRDALAEQVPDLRWIYLEASEALLRERLLARRGHFASTGILRAQLADLEPPEDALVIPASCPVPNAVAAIRAALGRTFESPQQEHGIRDQRK